jgi:DNA repair protein RAD16
MCHECASGLENRSCPVCRVKIEKIMKSEAKPEKKLVFGRKSILQSLKLSEFNSSSKLDAVVHEVNLVCEKGQKMIIFSQFTTFLDLIQWRLQSLQISTFCFSFLSAIWGEITTQTTQVRLC